MPDIVSAKQNFAANVFLELKWKDDRLVGDSAVEQMRELREVWNPRILITNKQGIVRRSMPDIVSVKPNGMVTYYQGFVGTFSQPMRLSEFPFDEHWFRLQFVSVGNEPYEVKFEPDLFRTDKGRAGGGMFGELSVPDWDVEEYRVLTRPFEPIEDVEVAGFAFEFKAKRYGLYYVWQVIIPLILIVMMSWGAFWIDPIHAGAQIGVATSSMLTLIAFRFMIGAVLPRLPYMTRFD